MVGTRITCNYVEFVTVLLLPFRASIKILQFVKNTGVYLLSFVNIIVETSINCLLD